METVVTSAKSIASLVVSIAALAFVAWIALTFPGQQSVYGPAPGASVAITL